MWPLWLVEMSLQHIPKNSPRLLPKPAKFEKNPPNGYRVLRKTKCGAGGAWRSPIHKQVSRKGRFIRNLQEFIIPQAFRNKGDSLWKKSIHAVSIYHTKDKTIWRKSIMQRYESTIRVKTGFDYQADDMQYLSS